MSPPSERDSQRLAMLRRLQDENREAQGKLTQLQREYAQRSERIKRLQTPYPEGDICPLCWDEHGRHVPLRGDVAADEPSRFDRFRCREYGYYEDRPTR